MRTTSSKDVIVFIINLCQNVCNLTSMFQQNISVLRECSSEMYWNSIWKQQLERVYLKQRNIFIKHICHITAPKRWVGLILKPLLVIADLRIIIILTKVSKQTHFLAGKHCNCWFNHNFLIVKLSTPFYSHACQKIHIKHHFYYESLQKKTIFTFHKSAIKGLLSLIPESILMALC